MLIDGRGNARNFGLDGSQARGVVRQLRGVVCKHTLSRIQPCAVGGNGCLQDANSGLVVCQGLILSIIDRLDSIKAVVLLHILLLDGTEPDVLSGVLVLDFG